MKTFIAIVFLAFAAAQADPQLFLNGYQPYTSYNYNTLTPYTISNHATYSPYTQLSHSAYSPYVQHPLVYSHVPTLTYYAKPTYAIKPVEEKKAEHVMVKSIKKEHHAEAKAQESHHAAAKAPDSHGHHSHHKREADPYFYNTIARTYNYPTTPYTTAFSFGAYTPYTSAYSTYSHAPVAYSYMATPTYTIRPIEEKKAEHVMVKSIKKEHHTEAKALESHHAAAKAPESHGHHSHHKREADPLFYNTIQYQPLAYNYPSDYHSYTPYTSAFSYSSYTPYTSAYSTFIHTPFAFSQIPTLSYTATQQYRAKESKMEKPVIVKSTHDKKVEHVAKPVEHIAKHAEHAAKHVEHATKSAEHSAGHSHHKREAEPFFYNANQPFAYNYAYAPISYTQALPIAYQMAPKYHAKSAEDVEHIVY